MRRSYRLGYLLLLPALFAFAAYVVYPILATCVLSFYSWSAVQQVKLPVGLQNYINLFHDPNFYVALRNNGYFILISLAVQLPLALLIALGLGSSLRRHQVLRTLLFSPFVLPVVAVGLVWRLIYEPNLGALNSLLTALHAGQLAHAWLGESTIAIFAVIAVSCWRYVGFHTMIVLAGLQGIPDDMYEAAKLDGASSWQAFLHVTLPMLRRVLLVDGLLITVGSVKIFDLVKVMTDGGPGYSSDVLATFMFRSAFTEDRMGYSAAIAVVMLLVTLAFTVVYLRLTNLEEVAVPPALSQWFWRLVGVAAPVGVLALVFRHTHSVASTAWFAVSVAVVVLLIVGLARGWDRLPPRVAAGVRDGFFILLAALFLLPVLWAVLGSFKTLNGLLLNPWGLPHHWLLSNYAQAWRGGIGRFLLDSMAVATMAVLIALAFSAPASYAFARLRLPAATILFGLIVSGILLPVHASLIPLYIQSNRLGIANWPALIGPYVAFGLPLMVLMLRAYFAGIPEELCDAAVMDGCGHLRTLWHVMLPVARPAIAAVAIFQASWVWNELPLAMVLIRDSRWQVLPVGLLNFQGEHAANWAVIMAGVTIALVPVLVLYFVFQRHIVKGLTAGAVR